MLVDSMLLLLLWMGAGDVVGEDDLVGYSMMEER